MLIETDTEKGLIMPDLSLHPVYLSARAAIVAPERAIPVTLYATQKWLPRLGPERWCLVLLLRSMCVDTPRRSDGTKRVTCSWRELADMLNVHEETVASWLKHKPLANDRPWRAIIPSDEKAQYLSLFIPRLRYAYETRHGKTRRVGFLLEILMEDPVVLEDEARLQQQIELLRMQQGELGLETYRLNENVNPSEIDLPELSKPASQPKNSDLRYVNPSNSGTRPDANPLSPVLHNELVNRENTDLWTTVKQDNSELDSYVNPLPQDLAPDKSEESGKNVNELDILIQQLKHNNLRKNLRRPAFEPVIQLTERLLEDRHSEAMLYKVLNALYPERLDLYVAAVRVALEAAAEESGINRGAVFVRSVRDFADIAGVDLGLKRASTRATDWEESGEEQGTWVPENPSLPVSPLSVNENEAIWAETQSVLSRQMTRATYDAIIQGTVLLHRGKERYLVGVQTEMAKEWLENRLRELVQRSLATVVGSTVTVEFTLIDITG